MSQQFLKPPARRALVVGLGVAGMSAALGLKRAGWDVQIIERAPERRTGGYFVGLSAEAFEAARYLGISPALRTRTPGDYKTWEIDERGKWRHTLSFTEQPNKPEAVLRGDIEEALWAGVDGQIEVRFSTVPVAIGSNAQEAVVRLRCTKTGAVTDETFDLVVGADGLRSTVRQQVFGPHEEYMRPHEAVICAFQLQEQAPKAMPNDGIIIAENKRSLWIFPFSDRPPTALFTYRPDDVDAQFRLSPGDALRQAFAGMSGDGVVTFALDQFDKTDSFLFDSVHEIEMPRWHHNRVVMLGDAAWCMTLYSGYGATSSMHGGALLGKHLTAIHDIDLALGEWEREMRGYITRIGRTTPVKAQVFVPSNRLAFGVRWALLTSGALARVRAIVESRKKAKAKASDGVFGERSR